MATDEGSIDVHDHGTTVDRKRQKVRCNYCAKVVSGYNRLKQHLGGVRGDVVPCVEVPEDVKVQMRNSLLDRKKEALSKEVLQLFHSDVPWKGNSCSNSAERNSNHLESIQPTLSGKRKHIMVDSLLEEDEKQLFLFPSKKLDPHTTAKSEIVEDESSRQAQRCMGRFFFENGIDFSAAKSFSFQKMIHAFMGRGSTRYKVPSCNDLKGWILEEEMEAIQEYVQEVRYSWGSTGCSILLDGWTNEKGRNLINFLVDSPRGPIFLRSADVSNSIGDVDAMMSLLSGVIEEVGVENVVQIVTYTTLDSMEALGTLLAEKHRSIFWTVSASHCIGLMLEKIGMTGPGKEVLNKAKTITKFIYSHETILKLMRKHTFGLNLVISSRIRSTIPFLTLERIVCQKENLENMFSSSAWNSSTWASTADGRKVADLVWETSFWTEARALLKASIPLIRALHLINGGDNKPQLGYIYETMDQAKEAIKEEYKDKKAKYLPFWKIIDGIWDNHLHSPLHSAGYFLNPSLFYSTDFFADAEVASGLLCCIVRMVEDKHTQDLIVAQLDDYRAANGAFGEEVAVDQRTKIAPAMWWSLYGGECPELQRLAIRILCQTCTGGLRYDLKRSLSEKLHMSGRNRVEQQRLNELTYVSHNLRLQQFLSVSNKDYSDIFLEEIDPMDEWVGGREVEEMAQQNNDNDDDDSGGLVMDNGCGDKNITQSRLSEEEASGFKPKKEPYEMTYQRR